MTKLIPNDHHAKITGAVTLFLAVLLMLVSSLIVIFAGNSGVMQEKISGNMIRNTQAFQAAEAGLEYGINYLDRNSDTILANPVNGYIQPYSDSNTDTVNLSNGSQYTITYSNPIQNNYDLILITSTGKSNDRSATRVISQLVQSASLLKNPAAMPLRAIQAVTLQDSALVKNLENSVTIQSGNAVSLQNSATTQTSSGGSSAGMLGADIQANDTTLANTSQNDLFASVFGITTTSMQSQVAHRYNSNRNRNWSNILNGMEGTSVWINQNSGTATINGSAVIGTSDNPVLLIVNGNMTLGGNAIIHGYVYVMGSGNYIQKDSASIVGDVMLGTSGTGTLSLNSSIIYNSAVLNALMGLSSIRYYTKVAGSWKDF